MREQIENAINFIKGQPIDACITGSILLDYFEGENQDIDVFVYDEFSFRKLLAAFHYSEMFQILAPEEQWKYDEYINKGQSSLKKFGLISIKFKYNLCIDVNIICKNTSKDAFSVLSNFDLDIICKAYDIRSGQTLDLTGNNGKVADWNRWNKSYYEINLWKVARLLRQIERCFKYHKRGYNTDKVVLKYIDIMNKTMEFESVFNSETFNERIDNYKEDLKIVKMICEEWLRTHEISEAQLEKLRKNNKEF